MFNSYTGVHPLTGVTPAERQVEQAERARLRSQGVDAYALGRGATLTFKALQSAIALAGDSAHNKDLNGRCEVWYSKYEDMVARPVEWARRLIGVLRLKGHAAKLVHTFALNQGKLEPDNRTHTAYVYPGAYATILHPETVANLTARVAQTKQDLLHKSGYF